MHRSIPAPTVPSPVSAAHVQIIALASARDPRPHALPRVVDALLAVAACIALLGSTAGCQARRAGVPRDSLEVAASDADDDSLPGAADALRLRVPSPAAAPAEITGPPAFVAFARGEVPPVAARGDRDVDATALRCLHAGLVRDYGRVVQDCLAFASAAPLDPRVAVAVLTASTHRGSLPEAGRRALLDGLGRIVPACAAARAAEAADARTCSELAVVVDFAARTVAASLGDQAALDALRPGGDLVHATAEGPFLNGDEAFAGSPFASRPLVKHARFRVLDIEERNGVLSPSRRGVDGWWRLTLRGESPVERKGLLALRADGAVEVRLDGVPVFVRRADDVGAAVELVAVKLGAGMHVIEVLALETGRGIRVSAFDDDGQALLRPVARQRWARTAGATVVPAMGLASALPVPQDPERGDATAMATLLFRHALARAGVGATVDDERVLARMLIDRFGWSAPALVAAAQTVEDDALPDRIAVSLAAPLWTKALQQWPTNPVGLIAVARAAAEERPDEALAWRRAVVAARPDYPIGRRELIDALLERGVIDEARKNADALLALGETNENIDAAADALRATGDVTRGLRLVGLRSRRTVDDQGDDGRQLLTMGDRAGARALLGNRVAGGDDRALGAWLDLVELDDPAAALQTLTTFCERFPDDVDLALRRARLAARVDGPAAGLAGLDSLTTIDVRALRLRAAWGGEAAFGDRRARGDDVIARHRAAASTPHAGFPTVFLLDDFERRYADDGTSVVVRHWIAELRTKDALDAFGELRVDDNEVLVRLRVVKADGRIVEPERHAGVDDVSLPGLAPGDIVEYLSFSADSHARDGGAWETRSLVRATPAISRSYVVEVPFALARNRQLRVLVENGASPPSISTTGPPGRERTRYVFAVDNAAPLLDEPGSVDRLESEPQGGVAIDVDDEVFRRRRAQPFFRNARVDPWLRDVAALVAGRGTEAERAQRLFRFVAQSVVAADSPADAVQVLAVGRGQRQPLFHALARAAGIDVRALGVHPVLELERRIPHVRAYPIVLTEVTTDGEPHIAAFLDGGAQWDGLAPWFGDAETLDLADGTRGTLDPRHVSRDASEVVVDLGVVDDAAGRRLAGTVAVRLPPWMAGQVRPVLRKIPEARFAELFESALAASLPGVKATRVTTPGLATEARPLALVANVEVPLTTSTVRLEHLFAGGALAAFRLAPPVASFATVADRHRALAVAAGSERLVVRLRLPERGAFVEIPPAVTVTAGPFSLRQRSAVDDRNLTFERELERKTARVTPAAWPGVRAALAPLAAQTDARVAFLVAPER
jgi:hypothetical protein